MLTSIRKDTFQQVILGAGILFTQLDFTHATTCGQLRDRIQTAMTTPGAVLGTTKGPGTLQIKPMYHQMSLNALRTATEGGLRVDGWTVRITGTLAEVSPHTLATLLPFTHTQQTGDIIQMTLSTQAAPASAIPHLTWVGDTGMGLMLVDIPQAVNTLGAELKLNPQGEAVIPFSFLGQLIPGEGEQAPCTVRFYQEG